MTTLFCRLVRTITETVAIQPNVSHNSVTFAPPVQNEQIQNMIRPNQLSFDQQNYNPTPLEPSISTNSSFKVPASPINVNPETGDWHNQNYRLIFKLFYL